MRKMFHKEWFSSALFLTAGSGRKKNGGQRLRFRKADLPEAIRDVSNPARGFYQIHTFCADREPDLEAERWCLHQGDTLALVLIDIGGFRDRPLDETALSRIRRILDFFVQNRYDMILRVVYDHEGNGLEREPFTFAQVLSHLEQLGPVFAAYAGSIFVLQGMLVGSWGEMHTSRFLSGRHLTRMADILRTFQGEDTYLAVRRPVYWRMLHEPGRLSGGCRTSPMGLYDDGMFGSESHMGTFGGADRAQTAWEKPWSRADELTFAGELGSVAPNGGETVYGDGQMQTAQTVLDGLRAMQITYLNRRHDAKALECWKSWRFPGRGPWAGKSVLDYVGAHLGYRFVIRSVLVTLKEKGSGVCLVELEVENTGFGSFYQEAGLYLEYQDRSGTPCAAPFPCRMKGWRSGERRRISLAVEAGAGVLYVSGRRTRDGTVIRFAHGSDGAGRTRLGELWEKGKRGAGRAKR